MAIFLFFTNFVLAANIEEFKKMFLKEALIVILFLGILIYIVILNLKKSVKTQGINLLNFYHRVLQEFEKHNISLTTVVRKNGVIVPDVDTAARQKEDLISKIVKEETNPELIVKRLTPFVKDEHYRVRAVAAVELYNYNKDLSLQVLKQMAKDSNKWVRATSAWAFGEIGTVEVVDFLVELLRDSYNDADETVRLQCEWALDKIDANKQIPQNIKTKVEENLLDSYSRDRANRVEILEKELKIMKNKDMAIMVLSHYLKDEDNRTRANAAKAIYPYSPKLSLKTLTAMLKSDNKWYRASACWALGQIKADKSCKMLLSMVNDSENIVQKICLRMLSGFIGEEKISPDLKNKINRLIVK